MTGINDRLRLVRNSLGISQREFSNRISMSQSVYCDMETGTIECRERYLKLIVSEFSVSMKYLKTGEGSMFVSDSPPDLKLENLIEIFKQFDSGTQDEVLDIMKSLLKIHKKN